jgi:predicted anti-sigma-YlaC factor YlaD
MSDCRSIQDQFVDRMDGALDDAASAVFDEHVAGCSECSELWEITLEVSGDATIMVDLEPPEHLGQEIAGSPCRRWLGMLFAAVDREITDDNLERLLTHLESCPACRRTWSDMTLVHQIGEALAPPEHLMDICLNPRLRRPRKPWVLGRRTATAAAYVLAVLTTIAVGNPVSLARYDAASAVEIVANTVGNEVEAAASSGRGEARVLLWRAMQWGERAADTVRTAVDRLRPGRDADDTDSSDSSKETPS